RGTAPPPGHRRARARRRGPWPGPWRGARGDPATVAAGPSRVPTMASVFDIELKDAVPPLVLALDVGSTASRGAVYDAHGRPVGKRAKVPHTFTTAPDGTSEIDADQVVDEVTTLIDQLVEALDGTPVAGVALDTFASSMVVVDGDGRPLTPCFTYADSRCAPHVAALRVELDEEALQQRT